MLRSPGRAFPLTTRYTPASSTPLSAQVAAAVSSALAETKGHLLVFLPGAAEIRDAVAACESAARPYAAAVLPLYGDLAPEQQDAAVASSAMRKIICSTNVAESSVTIDGVTAVIDSGLARVATHSPWTGLSRLEVTRVDRSSCVQRAGRAGRTGPGLAIRLYTEEDFLRRPQHLAPEILRADLSRTLLQLLAAGISPSELPWLDALPQPALDDALRLLRDLHLVDRDRRLTSLGKAAAASPVHPRLATLVLRATEFGDPGDAVSLAAILDSGRPRLPDNARGRFPSDVDALLTVAPPQRARRPLHELARRVQPPSSPVAHALEKAICCAFPDRVMRKRGVRWLLADAGSAQLDRTSATESEFAVALEVDDRSGQAQPLVRIACPIESNWLLDLFPQSIGAREALEWNREAERVEQTEQLLYRKLVIDENRARPRPGLDVAAMLLDKALEAGLDAWRSQPDVERFLARVEFTAAYVPSFPRGDELLRSALGQLACGFTSLRELREAEKNGTLLGLLQSVVDGRALDEIAPAALSLPSGRRARVDYRPGKPPSVASRLQDFFGLQASPSVARGAVPLLLELLAPNGRPVQVTTDLPSFWRNLYPQIRKELSRRYPRHSWPEAP